MPLVQTAHRLQVVGEHVRLGLDHGGDRLPVALEVGRKHLDLAFRKGIADRSDRRRPDRGPAVREVVPRDAGEDHVVEPHLPDRFGDAARLVLVGGIGLGRLDVAEPASAGALLAEDQEGGLPVLPALVDVRAPGLLAHRVEVEAPHDPLEVAVVRPERGLDLQPVRSPGVSRDRRLRASDRVGHVGIHERLGPVCPLPFPFACTIGRCRRRLCGFLSRVGIAPSLC